MSRFRWDAFAHMFHEINKLEAELLASRNVLQKCGLQILPDYASFLIYSKLPVNGLILLPDRLDDSTGVKMIGRTEADPFRKELSRYLEWEKN